MASAQDYSRLEPEASIGLLAASVYGDSAGAASNNEGRATESSPAPPPSNAPSPRPARIGTPVRQTGGTTANGERSDAGSRAASAHPETSFSIPNEAPPNGAPVRQYINSKLTGPLLEGMKLIAMEQPQDPLRVLGEYLLQRSKELEGTRQS